MPFGPIIALGLFFVAAAGASAHDGDGEVTFAGLPVAGRYQGSGVPFPGGEILRIGPSDPIFTAFGGVVFHGVLPDPGVRFEVSRRVPGGSWSPWVRAALHRRPNGRFWGKASFGKAASGTVRLRVLGGRPAVQSAFHLFEMAVDAQPPHRGAPELESPGFGVFGGTKPAVLAREAWGAKPPKDEPVSHVPVRFTQHHTAGVRTFTLEESLEEVLFIQEFHQGARGFSDIGYHFLVDTQGRIFQGRPEGVVGAHVKGHNEGNIGIALIGYHHPPYDHPLTPAQFAAIESLGKWITRTTAAGPADYLGHRDLGATSCPGDLTYGEMDRIRESFGNESGKVSFIRSLITKDN